MKVTLMIKHLIPDEDDEVYDPEVDDIRDESYLHGEFMEEQSSIDGLTETDVIRIQTESVFYWIKRKLILFKKKKKKKEKTNKFWKKYMKLKLKQSDCSLYF